MKKILSLILAAAVILSLTAGMAAKSLQSHSRAGRSAWTAPSRRTSGANLSFSGDKETCWAKHVDYGWDFWQNTGRRRGAAPQHLFYQDR